MAQPLEGVRSSRPLTCHLLHASRRSRVRRLPPTRLAGGRRLCRPVASWHPRPDPAVPARHRRGGLGRAHRARRPSPAEAGAGCGRPLPMTSYKRRCWRLRSQPFRCRRSATRYRRPTAVREADRSWTAPHQDERPLMVVVRGGFLTSRAARCMRAWAEAAGVGMQTDVRLKIRWHPVTLGLRQWQVVWRRRRNGGRQSRETAALRLGTARAVGGRPGRTGAGGIRICGDRDSGQKRRSQNRRFTKSEHVTPSSVSSALVEWTQHAPLIILL